ncbi:MAG: Rpn family recombination-promoting nuclease/putative transposase [Acidobacteria bacterium]|nr:Rpn family recombination-promoting nuclease/putative transposase [Acidobacteriota bacterium]
MKRARQSTQQPGSEKARVASDNLCKMLAEQFPVEFIQWAFEAQVRNVKVLKTELSREPIRADSATQLIASQDIFHAEFQTNLQSRIPLPLRMLDYYVGFKRNNLHKRIHQALIILKETPEFVPDYFADEQTYHKFRVIKMWEQDPQRLMQHDGWLPLAVLCRTESGAVLLKAVAQKIAHIKSREQRRETLSASQLLAGLRYDRDLIQKLFKEGTMLEESVIAQDWIARGKQQGLQQGETKVLVKLLGIRLGQLSPKVCKQIETLTIEQLDNLAQAVFDIKTKGDLSKWLKAQTGSR